MTELRRQLGVFTAAMMVVSGTIGSGIFVTPAEVAAQASSAPMTLLVWFVGGAVAFAGAFTYAALGARMPMAGGPYVYMTRAFGPLAGFLYGWMIIAVIGSGAVAALSLSFADYLRVLLPTSGSVPRSAVAIFAVALFTASHTFGLKPGAAIQTTLTLVKIIALATIVVGGLIDIPSVESSSSLATTTHPRPVSLGGLMAAFVPVLFTIGGWQQIGMLGEEVRDPERNIPKALILGVTLIVVLYMGVNVALLDALGVDRLSNSKAPVSELADVWFGPTGGIVFAAVALVSIAGFLHYALLANSRLPFALARDQLLPAVFGRVHARHGTPTWSVLLLGTWSIVLIVAAQGDLGTLLGGVVFADWLFFALGAAAVFFIPTSTVEVPAEDGQVRSNGVDRRRGKGARSLGYPWVPGLFVLTAAFGMLSAVVAAPRASGLGFALLTLGAVLFRVTKYFQEKQHG